ncbi:MAG: GAP family protein [candidate division Zixibacteria bacterium]|nr:GAP family protein [candidate division Zixibacteria bacterium]
MEPAISSVFAVPGLSLPIIVGLALVDSINPCVIGVLLVMLTVLLKTGDRRKILANGISYTVGVYVTYLIGGLTLLTLFNAVRSVIFISQILYFVIGTFVIIAGLLEVKDYFWYGRWFSLSIPKRFVAYVEGGVEKTHTSLYAAAFFGAIVTLIELPCTGAPYLAILALMSQGGMNFISGLPLLLLYNLVFVVPLLAIIAMVYYGFGIKMFEGWKQEHRGLMRLCIGLALLAVGIWIITSVAEYLLWPLIIGVAAVIVVAAFLKYVVKFGREWPY